MIEFIRVFIEHLPIWLPPMLLAAVGTLQLTVLSFVLAIAIGLGLALMRISGIPVLSGIALTYIEIVRGTPLLVLLAIIYFGLPSLNIEWLILSSFTAAVVGLGLHGGAFMAEIFRSGIEALHKGQMEAALSLGLTPAKAMRWVIFPQAARIVLPPLGNFAIGLLKDTAICSIIATPELMLRAKDLTSWFFMPMHMYVLAAMIYLAMSYPLSVFVRRLEARFPISGH
jgi:polar amino acid transport system permease protein